MTGKKQKEPQWGLIEKAGKGSNWTKKERTRVTDGRRLRQTRSTTPFAPSEGAVGKKRTNENGPGR